MANFGQKYWYILKLYRLSSTYRLSKKWCCQKNKFKTHIKKIGPKENLHFFDFDDSTYCTSWKYKNWTCVFIIDIYFTSGWGCTPTSCKLVQYGTVVLWCWRWCAFTVLEWCAVGLLLSWIVWTWDLAVLKAFTWYPDRAMCVRSDSALKGRNLSSGSGAWGWWGLILTTLVNGC